MADCKTKKMNIHEIIRSAWRNFPRDPSTMSMCECGRYQRRGSEPCLVCLKDAMEQLGIAPGDYFDLIKQVKKLEAVFIKIVGEDKKACLRK